MIRCSVPDLMVTMGYCRDDVIDSLGKMKYDDITATYLLLGRKMAEVRDRNRGDGSSVTPGCDVALVCLCRWR